MCHSGRSGDCIQLVSVKGFKIRTGKSLLQGNEANEGVINNSQIENLTNEKFIT